MWLIILVFILLLLVYFIRNSSNYASLWHDNIEQLTKANTEWRKVIHTSPNLQIALMAPPTGEELGWEVHPDNDQFFRFESGKGRLQIRDSANQTKTIKVHDGDAAVVTKGTYHNIISDELLKFYTIYGPPHHKPGTIDHTHADEIARERLFLI
jgi:mannose-6-phosphate isomerase-like protein (cupin superfamily)